MRGSAGSRGAVRPPPGTRPKRRGASSSTGRELGSAGAGAAIDSAATFLARTARTGRGAGELSAAGIGAGTMGWVKGSSGVDAAATFLVTRFAATFLTAVLLAAVLVVAFLAAVLVAAFLATRLGAGSVPSSLLLLIRNQLKGKCAVRLQSLRRRVDRKIFIGHFKNTGRSEGGGAAATGGFDGFDLGPRIVTGHRE